MLAFDATTVFLLDGLPSPVRSAKVPIHLGIPTKTYQNYEREVREADSVTLCTGQAHLVEIAGDMVQSRKYE